MGTYAYTLGQLLHAVRGHAVRMWPSAPKALRACTRVARGSNVARGSKRTRFAASRLSLPNQPKDNVTPTHTLWDNCCTRFEDTQFECGLRPLRPFGPVRVSHAVRMSHAVRTLEPNQPKDNVTPTHTLWDNCCTRFEETQFECGPC